MTQKIIGTKRIIIGGQSPADNCLNKDDLPIIAWFSCGATSAVACKIAMSMYKMSINETK